jgi:predicted ATP-grasp superfamily ATP-dependent carboligase
VRAFALRKLRQQPPGFGFGYRGVGSAEFKRDELDLRAWLQSLGGPKVYSNFAADDPIPGIQAIATNLAARRPARALVRSILRGLPRASVEQ